MIGRRFWVRGLVVLGLSVPLSVTADDVTERVGDASINWTKLAVECTKVGSRSGVGARQQAIEQVARRAIGPELLLALESVELAPETMLDGIEPRVQEAVRARVTLWSVHEAQYFRSGTIALDARLDLQGVLKPWALTLAEPPPRPARTADFTGLVVDARDLDFQPVYAPRLVTPDGGVIYAGTLWEDVVVESAPVVYVETASDAAVVRAGDNPLFVRATASKTAGVLTLDAEDAQELQQRAEGTRVLGDGTVVIVVGKGG